MTHNSTHNFGLKLQRLIDERLYTSAVPAPGPAASSISGPDLLAAIAAFDAEFPPAPDPLNGAAELVAAQDMIDKALELAAAVAGGPFGRQVLVADGGPYMTPGCIIGRKGLWEIVLLIGPAQLEEVTPCA